MPASKITVLFVLFASLPASLLAFIYAYLLLCPPAASKPTALPANLSLCITSSRHVCLNANHPASKPACRPTASPFCLCACLHLCIPVSIPVSLPTICHLVCHPAPCLSILFLCLLGTMSSCNYASLSPIAWSSKRLCLSVQCTYVYLSDCMDPQ
jgi:hypothetical protein